MRSRRSGDEVRDPTFGALVLGPIGGRSAPASSGMDPGRSAGSWVDRVTAFEHGDILGDLAFSGFGALDRLDAERHGEAVLA